MDVPATRKALYFPYIMTPDDAWFTRVLLYWDSVGTIMPGGLENDPRYVTRRMVELRSEGMLEDVSPAFAVDAIPAFGEAFLQHIDHDLEIQDRRRRPVEDLSHTQVHVFKLGKLAEELIERDLAKRVARQDSWELWLDVEQRTADLFMAYLAAVLGALEDNPMDPVTDRVEAMGALTGMDSATGTTLKRARELRLGVLDVLLPGPPPTVSAAELREFKGDHGDQLAAFRDAVDEELMKAASFSDEDARKEQAGIAARRLVRERDELVKLMEGRRWSGIIFGSVAGLAVAGSAVAAPFVVGGGAGAAAFAAPGLIPAIYGAIKDIRRRPDFGARPIAYAALAKKRFSS